VAGARDRAGQTLSRIGLLGGSFNPAHGGHRRISLFAAQALGLDAVWWLVSPGNPLKPKAGMAPLAARLASARKQARRASIVPTAIERELGTRYTIDTLRKLQQRFPQHRFVWLMGSDNLAQFHRWRSWRDIASLSNRARWSAPALIHLRFDPDPRSASGIRRADPDWARRYAGKVQRDPLTHRPVDPDIA
jgi:nicotinate-nucleotide adenylyltransferase